MPQRLPPFPPKPRTGLNNNSYQISRGLFHNNRAGPRVTETCKFVKADFMRMPFEGGAFDAVYEIDATCHAPDQVGRGWGAGLEGILRGLAARGAAPVRPRAGRRGGLPGAWRPPRGP
jgi:hypothetical protein